MRLQIWINSVYLTENTPHVNVHLQESAPPRSGPCERKQVAVRLSEGEVLHPEAISEKQINRSHTQDQTTILKAGRFSKNLHLLHSLTAR